MGNSEIEEVEILISKALKVGVLVSATVILIGLLMFIVTGSSGYANNVYQTNPLLIFNGINALKPYAIILAGLLILILTPVFRVSVSIIVFLKEKDYLYVRVTTLVFLILIISFFLGKI